MISGNDRAAERSRTIILTTPAYPCRRDPAADSTPGTNQSRTGWSPSNHQRVGHVDDALRGAGQRNGRLPGGLRRPLAGAGDRRPLSRPNDRGRVRLHCGLALPFDDRGDRFVRGPATPGGVVHCRRPPHDGSEAPSVTPRRIGAVQAHEGASAVPLPLWRDRSSRRQLTSREVPLAVSMRAHARLLAPHHATTRAGHVDAGTLINRHHTKIQATHASCGDDTGGVAPCAGAVS